MMEEVELFLGNILEICGEPFLIVTVMGHSSAQSETRTPTFLFKEVKNYL